jgi:hypothetical protein
VGGSDKEAVNNLEAGLFSRAFARDLAAIEQRRDAGNAGAVAVAMNAKTSLCLATQTELFTVFDLVAESGLPFPTGAAVLSYQS